MADSGDRARERRNMIVLALNTAAMRTGWVFKTESVIIPAFLDSIAGPGWVRGMLPLLNRLGSSIPPFLLSRWVKVSPRKAHRYAVMSFAMASCFLLLAVLALGQSVGPAVFLLVYLVFFAATGLHVQLQGTLQGKLVRPQRRGLLLTWSTVGGSVPAVSCVIWLLPAWLEQGALGWSKIFGFTGGMMLVSALLPLWLEETPDAHDEPPMGVARQLEGAIRILREDRTFRGVATAGALFATSLILLPHYQSLGRDRLGLEGADLMVWVAVQNVSLGFVSLFIGPLADRLGNRVVFRGLCLGTATVPLLALGMAALGPEVGGPLFPLVFVGIGLTPMGIRVLANYILEVAPESEHPRYLAINQLCTSLVLLGSPAFGHLLDGLGYGIVFSAVALLVGSGGLLTFFLEEPRADHRVRNRPGPE